MLSVSGFRIGGYQGNAWAKNQDGLFHNSLRGPTSQSMVGKDNQSKKATVSNKVVLSGRTGQFSRNVVIKMSRGTKNVSLPKDDKRNVPHDKFRFGGEIFARQVHNQKMGSKF